MLLSRVTAHKITNFRCKHLATVVTGNDDGDDDEDGATTSMTMTMAIARREMGYNGDGGRRQ